MRLNPLPFRVKIVLWYAAILLLTLLAFRLVSVQVVENSLYADLDASLRAEARWVRALIESYQERSIPDDEIRDEIAERSVLSPRKEYIEIHDASGRPYFRSSNLLEEGLVGLHPDPFSAPATSEGFRDHNVRLFATREKEFTIYLGYPLTDIESAIEDVIGSFIILVPVAAVLAAIGGIFLVSRFVQPIRDLEDRADQLVKTPLDHPLPPLTERRDEIGELMARFHHVVEAMRGSARQAVSFSSLASHELRTPLAVLRSQLENALESEMPADGLRQALASTYDEVLRMGRIVDDLLELGTLEAQTFRLNLASIDLLRMVEDFAQEAQALCESKAIRFTWDARESATIRADETRIRQALFNLLDNAIKHTRSGGQVRLTSGLDDGRAIIALADNGEGIAPESMPRIFDFFYRGGTHHGTGLGLPLVKRIVEAHHGEIDVWTRVGEGTTVTIRLPVQA